MASVWAEMKRRNVVRVAIAYAIVAWLLIEISSTTFPILRLPDWATTLVTVLLLLGFPVAVIFAWAFELTPDGIKREEDVGRSESITPSTGRKLDFLVIAVLGAAVVYFVAEKVFWADEGSALTPTVTEQSIAVLPLVDMSPNKDQEYFSDGIAEELLNRLTSVPGLRVAGRTSSFSFKNKDADLKEIGEKLNVAHILEGSVRKAGDHIRITAQLVKAADGFHLWSQTYDRDLTDIFAIQDEIAQAVAGALSITLGVGAGDLSTGGTRNIDAYDAFLAGASATSELGPDSTAQAIELLEQAVALDPDYAQAWSALTFAYDNAATYFVGDRTEELYGKCDAAAMRAVDIAPEATGPVLATAYVQMRNREWLRAEQSFKKALALAPGATWPSFQYGQFLMSVGRPQEAMTHYQRASTTDPLLLLPLQQLALAHAINDEFDLALKEYKRGQDLIGNQAFQQVLIAVLGMEMGDRTLTEGAFEKAFAAEGLSPSSKAFISMMVPLLDSPNTGKATLHHLYQDPDFNLRVNRSGIATWASYFGDHELALSIYRELFEPRAFAMYVIWQPIFKEMRRLSGFKELAREVGLVDYWRSTGNWGDFCRPLGHADFECK